jgi:hypothetical protein
MVNILSTECGQSYKMRVLGDCDVIGVYPLDEKGVGEQIVEPANQ